MTFKLEPFSVWLGSNSKLGPFLVYSTVAFLDSNLISVLGALGGNTHVIIDMLELSSGVVGPLICSQGAFIGDLSTGSFFTEAETGLSWRFPVDKKTDLFTEFLINDDWVFLNLLWSCWDGIIGENLFDW